MSTWSPQPVVKFHFLTVTPIKLHTSLLESTKLAQYYRVLDVFPLFDLDSSYFLDTCEYYLQTNGSCPEYDPYRHDLICVLQATSFEDTSHRRFACWGQENVYC